MYQYLIILGVLATLSTSQVACAMEDDPSPKSVSFAQPTKMEDDPWAQAKDLKQQIVMSPPSSSSSSEDEMGSPPLARVKTYNCTQAIQQFFNAQTLNSMDRKEIPLEPSALLWVAMLNKSRELHVLNEELIAIACSCNDRALLEALNQNLASAEANMKRLIQEQLIQRYTQVHSPHPQKINEDKKAGLASQLIATQQTFARLTSVLATNREQEKSLRLAIQPPQQQSMPPHLRGKRRLSADGVASLGGQSQQPRMMIQPKSPERRK